MNSVTPAAPPPPLAEGRWLWRRLYVFVTSLVLWSLLTLAVARTPPPRLPQVADSLMGLLGLVLILYLVAPTAQQMVELLANLKLRLCAGGR